MAATASSSSAVPLPQFFPALAHEPSSPEAKETMKPLAARIRETFTLEKYWKFLSKSEARDKSGRCVQYFGKMIVGLIQLVLEKRLIRASAETKELIHRLQTVQQRAR